MFKKYFSSSPRGQSVEDTLKLADEQLKNARQAKTPAKKLQFCNNAKSKIKDAEKIFATQKVDNKSMNEGIAAAYFEHGRILSDLGHHDKASDSYAKAKRLGYDVSVQLSAGPPIALPSTPTIATVATQDALNLDTAQPSGQNHIQKSIPGIEDGISKANVDTPLLQQIFQRNVVLPLTDLPFPKDSRHITSTPQLAYCLSLLPPFLAPNEELDKAKYEWSQAVVNDPVEQEQYQMIATNLVRAFIRDEFKKPEAVAEVVSLAAVIDKDSFRKLLQTFVDGIEHSVLLELHLLDGLPNLIRNSAPGYIDTDDLVKILELLSTRLQGIHAQSTQRIYLVAQAVSNVLDSMVDNRVKDLKREELHEPLLLYLRGLQASNDPLLVYQAAYAYKALQYIPDNETALQAVLRRTGKVVQGISGVVSAAKALNLAGFIDGLEKIQSGLSDAADVAVLVKNTFINAKALAENGQTLLECIKDGFSFQHKSPWYLALRGLDLLLQEGQLVKFEELVRKAPCRQDAGFQWGVCQRLGEIAANSQWDIDTRQCATSFLVQLYKDDLTWGQQPNVKQWMLSILGQLAHISDETVAGHARKQLQELDANQSLLQVDTEGNSNPYPLILAHPPQTFPLLDIALNKSDVESSLSHLKRSRQKVQDGSVYIFPRAKASQAAKEDFDLTSHVHNFLADKNKKVFLLLGDSGAGKSTFNKALEISLWEKYKNGEPIPLFIHLPTIDTPEIDLIPKHLRRWDFTEQQIRELKLRHEFILICDGYDESQLTRNIYRSNQLNDGGGWRVQMVISCRSEYSDADYKSHFRPTDRNGGGGLGLMQEAVISPFSKDQIRGYIDKYVSMGKSSWGLESYLKALKQIPNLEDLVKNPFLLRLALEVLPTMVDTESDFSRTQITRVGLYDEFVAQWLDRSKIRLAEMDLSASDEEALRRLSLFGFKREGINYLKELAAAIYDNHGGNPVVRYSGRLDQKSWKEAHFGRTNGKNLLQEAIPLIRNDNEYAFIHKSVLEFGLTLAIFDPSSQEEEPEPMPISSRSRRGSASSLSSFEVSPSDEETTGTTEQPIVIPHFGKRSFVKEPSILMFLVERAKQHPIFRKQLHGVIQLSKTDKTMRVAAANAITVLVRAGIQFNRADLRGIKVPGADLSYGMFDSVQLEGADLRKVNLRGVWLRNADLTGAQMAGVQFGESPFLQEDNKVGSCLYSPDGKTFAVGFNTGDISLYDTSSWRKIRTWNASSQTIERLHYSPKGDRIVSAGWDGKGSLWDIETGDCLHTYHGLNSDDTAMFSPKGGYIAYVGSDNKTALVCSIETGDCACTLEGHDLLITSLVYSPEGDQIATGSDDKTVRLWDVETGGRVHTLQGHSDHVYTVIYSPKGDRVASTSKDHTIRLWDVETGNCLHILQNDGSIICIAYSPKGDQIASGSPDKTVRLWNVETGDCAHILQGHTSSIRKVLYSPKGDQIASNAIDKTIRLWDTETGDCVSTLEGHSGRITDFMYSPKGDQIASGSHDKTVRLWDAEARNYDQTLQGGGGEIWSVVFSPKGGQIASGSDDETVRIRDVETGKCLHTLLGHSDCVCVVVYSPKGDKVATGSWDETIRLWDVETGSCIHEIQTNSGFIWSVAYSPKGDQIASGVGHEAWLWDVESGNCLHTLQGHSGFVNIVVYSPKGDQIASGSVDFTVRLWDVETGNCLHTLQGHSKEVKSIVYSPRGDRVVSGSTDGTVRLWDAESGKCIHDLQEHTSYVHQVAYSPKGNQIASGSSDSTARLWDVETGSCIHILQGHSQHISSLEYSSYGDRIASGSEDQTARVWNTETGQCLVVIRGFNGGVQSLAWENDLGNQYLVTGSMDNSVRRWQIINDRDGYKALLCWSSSHGTLTVTDASLDDVQGLTALDWMLLRQLEVSTSSSTAM